MKIIIILLSISIALFGADGAPLINLSVAQVEQPEQFVKTINIAIILALFVLAPSLLLMATSFIVFGLLRQAMGLQQSPPNQVIISLALVMTFFIMQPYGKTAGDDGIKPYMDKNTRESDLALFYRIKKEPNPQTIDDVSIITLLPAFMISELRTAFEIGFLIFLPFLVIDIIVSSILMSLGMMMLPPVMISLPIKLVFFIIIDGWFVIIGNLAQSFK